MGETLIGDVTEHSSTSFDDAIAHDDVIASGDSTPSDVVVPSRGDVTSRDGVTPRDGLPGSRGMYCAGISDCLVGWAGREKPTILFESSSLIRLIVALYFEERSAWASSSTPTKRDM